MDNLQAIVETINQEFSEKAVVRDATLTRSRELIRYCANSIRATHRGDAAEADKLLEQADTIAVEMTAHAQNFIDIYYAGYTQDSLKELTEAHVTRTLILGDGDLPSPRELKVENAAYLNGLAETVGELRRYALDMLRRGNIDESERVLHLMDEIYISLTTVDFPSAITHDLRRRTDVARGILERTRGDVTTAARQESMKKALAAFEAKIKD